MEDEYVGTAQDAASGKQREAEHRKIHELKNKSASVNGQPALLQFGSSTSEVPSSLLFSPPTRTRRFTHHRHLRMLFGKDLFHKKLGAMADVYGPMFTIRLGLAGTLVVSNWEAAREYFKDKLRPMRESEVERAVNMFSLFSGFVLSDVIPALGWLDLGRYKKSMKQTGKELDHLVTEWLDEHK